jgi:hypothetical protein
MVKNLTNIYKVSTAIDQHHKRHKPRKENKKSSLTSTTTEGRTSVDLTQEMLATQKENWSNKSDSTSIFKPTRFGNAENASQNL